MRRSTGVPRGVLARSPGGSGNAEEAGDGPGGEDPEAGRTSAGSSKETSASTAVDGRPSSDSEGPSPSPWRRTLTPAEALVSRSTSRSSLASRLARRFKRKPTPDHLRERADDFQRYLNRMPSNLSRTVQRPKRLSGDARHRSVVYDGRTSVDSADAAALPSERSLDESTLPLVDNCAGSHGDLERSAPSSLPLEDVTVETGGPSSARQDEPVDGKPAWKWFARHEDEVRRWLDDMPLGHEGAAPVPHDIWRGLPISRMLAQGPSLMANSQTEETFLLSEQLDASQTDIDIFLSHTWSSNEYLKYTAMLYYFNGRSSFVAAHSAALAVFLMLLAVKQLTPYGDYLPVFYVPMPGNVEEYPRGLPVCGPCFFIGCVVQIGTYIFGHFIWFWTRGVYRKTVFLDKCCIHQTDIDKKRRGVEHVGSFVKQSRSMFIPFDDDYFERLWCAYELAAFVRYKRSDVINTLNFMPIKVAVFVFAIALLGFIGTTGFMFMVAVNDLLFQFWIPQNWLEYFAIWGTGGTLIFGVPKFIFCHLSLQSRKILDDKLANFTVHNAKVTVEEDRTMIEQCIREWFGTVQVFDLIVQRVFPEIVNRALGTEAQALRFADVLQENAGVLFLFIYDASLAAYPDTNRVARALAIGFSAHFVIDPLFLYSLNMLAAAALKLPFSTLKNHAIRGLGVFIVGLAYPAWFAFCIGSPIWVIGAVTLGLGAFVPLIFKM